MKRLLLVTDFQKDFVDGALGFDGAEVYDERIAAKIAEYHTNGDEVIFTMDTHQKGYLQTQEGCNLPVNHCIEGTPGWQLYGRTAEAKLRRDPVFYKPGFGSAALCAHLDTATKATAEAGALPYSSIEVVGLVTHICVMVNATIAKTACPEVPIIVDATCVGSYDKKLHEEALDVMEGLQIKVLNR